MGNRSVAASNNTNNNALPATTNTSTAPSSSSSQQQPQQQIFASGCLGHQVRIWDWITGTCLQMIRLEFAIISLSFHPAGTLLAIANGTRLHFWGLPTIKTEISKITCTETERETNTT